MCQKDEAERLSLIDVSWCKYHGCTNDRERDTEVEREFGDRKKFVCFFYSGVFVLEVEAELLFLTMRNHFSFRDFKSFRYFLSASPASIGVHLCRLSG